MARNSEFNSYTFIKNDLNEIGWNVRNPNRDPLGEVFTQQECLDHPEIGAQLGRQKPEYVVKIRENGFWVIEAKGNHNQLEQAFNEAVDYANLINRSSLIQAFIVSGVAGNDIDGYLIKTAIIHRNGTTQIVQYNSNSITGLLSPDQAKYLFDNSTNLLNELVSDEKILLSIAEKINEELHSASINKDKRASVMSSILLSMVSDTLPNFSASPSVFIRDINNRAEDVLIAHSKREFAAQIELSLPQEEAAKAKYKQALIKVYFLLRKINVKAAMNGGQDILGKFYEVFLKYGNGAKDIGIVLTPRHITKFACEVLDVNENDIVFDPACGTGGFLVAAYDKVRNNNPTNLDHFKKHKIFGVEQQANVATLAIVNMIFRGDGKNNIINEDCFAVNLNRKIRNGELSAEYISETPERLPVTKVLMNPPFALKKDDEKEYKFIEHSLKQMANGGLLFAVLPISIMYSSGNNFEWRKRFLQSHTLVSVASFSNELFYPQATVQPVTIIIKKGEPHPTNQKVAWVRVTNDGFRKHKRKRLPTGENEQIDLVESRLRDFIVNGNDRADLQGVIEFKPISPQDTKLELIPENYIDSPLIDNSIITLEMKKVFSDITFQGIKKALTNENI
ncbi:MAG: class I SAM-dependent DNA methyltransferase [Spirosomataceae bacterium]